MDLEGRIGGVNVALLDPDCYCDVHSLVAVRNIGGADVAEFASAGFILCKRELLCWRNAGGIIIRDSAGGTSTWANLREDGCVEIGGTSGVGGVGMLF